MARAGLVRIGLALATATVVAALASGLAPAVARAPAPALPTVTLAELPPQARATYRLIRAGGPFPFERDGGVFFNRERLLPQQPRGHYRAYTVPTPGATTRGPRRIVCGGAQPTAPEACFYTADHYASFSRIVAAP
jgi:ribonuclease T1